MNGDTREWRLTMFDTTNELMTAIQLGEDTLLELKDLRYKGDKLAFLRPSLILLKSGFGIFAMILLNRSCIAESKS